MSIVLFLELLISKQKPTDYMGYFHFFCVREPRICPNECETELLLSPSNHPLRAYKRSPELICISVLIAKNVIIEIEGIALTT